MGVFLPQSRAWRRGKTHACLLLSASAPAKKIGKQQTQSKTADHKQYWEVARDGNNVYTAGQKKRPWPAGEGAATTGNINTRHPRFRESCRNRVRTYHSVLRGRRVSRSVGQSIRPSVFWSVGQSIIRSVDQSVSRLVGRSVGRLPVRLSEQGCRNSSTQSRNVQKRRTKKRRKALSTQDAAELQYVQR